MKIDITKIFEESSQIEDATLIQSWFFDGVIDGSSFLLKAPKISITGGFLRTLVEQEVSLLFSKFPDYKLEGNNSNAKELIYKHIEENERFIYEQIKLAVKNYVIYGAGLIRFFIENNNLTLAAHDPCNVIFDLKNNKFIAAKGFLSETSKAANKLGSTNKEILQIDTMGKRYYFANEFDSSKKIVKNLNYPNTFSAIFNKQENRIVSNLLRVQELLKNHENLTNKMLDLQVAATRAKGILDDRFANMYDELMKDKERVQVVSGSISSANLISPFSWVDFTPLVNILNNTNSQIELLENKIYEILGLSDIFQANEIDPNETVVNAIDRTNKANVLWQAKQEQVNFFVSDIVNKYIENLLFFHNKSSDLVVKIETDSIGLIERQQKELEQNQTLNTIIGLIDKAAAVAQSGNIQYIGVLKEFSNSLLQKSKFSNNLTTLVDGAFSSIAGQIKNNQLVNQEPNPEQVLTIEGAKQQLAKGNLEIEKKQLENEKLKNEVQNAPLDTSLKEAEIQEKRAKTAEHWTWIKEAFKRLIKRAA